jgi:hypothetical protein
MTDITYENGDAADVGTPANKPEKDRGQQIG